MSEREENMLGVHEVLRNKGVEPKKLINLDIAHEDARNKCMEQVGLVGPNEDARNKCVEQGDLMNPHDDAESFVSNSDTRDGRWICPHDNCEKIFLRASRLRVHLRTHTGERPYVCQCGKSYARNQHLRRHELTHLETPKTQDIRCPVEGCSRMLSHKANLKKHIRRMHNEQRYKCKEEGCDKIFRKVHQLRAHSYEHKGVLPFQCHHEGCQRQFTQRSHLERHFKSHEGYSCPKEDCNEKFGKWSDARKHIQAVHNSFVCKSCGKRFKASGQLKQHALVHGEREPIPCPVEGCNKTYMVKRNVTAHIRSCHQGVRFPCTHCGNELISKQKLQEHLKTHTAVTVKKKYPNKGHRKKKREVLQEVTEFIMTSQVKVYMEPESINQEIDKEPDLLEASLVVQNHTDGRPVLLDVLGGAIKTKKTRWRKKVVVNVLNQEKEVGRVEEVCCGNDVGIDEEIETEDSAAKVVQAENIRQGPNDSQKQKTNANNDKTGGDHSHGDGSTGSGIHLARDEENLLTCGTCSASQPVLVTADMDSSMMKEAVAEVCTGPQQFMEVDAVTVNC